jgi:hypothetical protein
MTGESLKLDIPAAPAGELVRSVTFLAAWDKRDSDPAKSHGVHGVEILFLLKGPAGVVCFPLMTNWMLPEVEEWHRQLARENPGLGTMRGAFAAPFSFHSPVPREGWKENKEPCEFLGVPCWTTMSGYLAPDAVWEKMLREGSEGFWSKLEELYSLNLTQPTQGEKGLNG